MYSMGRTFQRLMNERVTVPLAYTENFEPLQRCVRFPRSDPGRHKPDMPSLVDLLSLYLTTNRNSGQA